MESRLLTDEELAKAGYPALDAVPSHWLTGRPRRIADAASAKTYRIDCEELGKWMGEECHDDGHSNLVQFTKYHCIREDCPDCPDILRNALREGRMPGEKNEQT